MKKLMALALTAALTLTSAVVVFADDYDYEYYGYGYEEYEEYEEVVAIAAVEHVPFTGTARLFTGGWGTILGYLPVFPGNAALNQRVESLVTVTYYSFLQVDTVSRPRPAGMEVLSFTVEETLTAARIEIFMLTDNLVKDSIYTIYIDKANNTEITAAAFAASAELEEVVAEPAEEAYAEQGEVEVIEVFMSPVRINAEAAGFTVIWHYDGAVLVYDESLVLNILTGSTLATLVEEDEETIITLDAAPVNRGGIVYVPSTLLTDVLGIQFTLLTSSDTAPVPAAIEAVEEYDEYEDYMVFETIVRHDVAEATLFELFAAEFEAQLLAELYAGESLEVIIGEGYELTLIINSNDPYLVEEAEADGLEIAQGVREDLELEYFIFTIRIIGLDGTVLFDETFEV